MLRVRHITRYRYARPVRFGEHRMMLRPREDPDQKLLFERLRITPEPLGIELQQDSHGNFVAIAQFDSACGALCFDSEIAVGRETLPPLPGLRPFPVDVMADDADPAAWAMRFLGRRESPGFRTVTAMNAHIHRAFAYRRRLEPGVQSPDKTLALRSGACRDFAVLLGAGARALGLEARFVSGYVHCPELDGGAPELGGGHTHAWAQVLTPEAGWIDFDPTSGRVGPEGLIRIAVADDPAGAVPIQGVYLGEAADFLSMQVDVAIAAEPLASNSPTAHEPSPLSGVA